VDSRLVTSEAEVRPGEIITFVREFRDGSRWPRGTPGEHALRGDILMLVDGQRVPTGACRTTVIVSSFEPCVCL
jgi:hypothetical protein